MFGKKDNQHNERVIYQAKPNIIFGCKKVIIAFILLVFVLSLSGSVIRFMGEMQVYLISRIQLPLTRYTAIGIFVIILMIILYIIWQIIGWYAKEYILTDSKIIVKTGVLLNRRNYMPYVKIQDINTSQSIFARLFNIGSVSVYSAYDNNQIALENISNPSEVEEIIFSRMTHPGDYYPHHPQNFNNYQTNENYYQNNDDYYNDRVITQVPNEEVYSSEEYEYYPENLNYNSNQKSKYEYEPYTQNLENDITDRNYQEYPNSYHGDYYYNEKSNEYPYSDEEYYPKNDDFYYDSSKPDSVYEKKDVADDSSEKIIKRHFDKFKK